MILAYIIGIIIIVFFAIGLFQTYEDWSYEREERKIKELRAKYNELSEPRIKNYMKEYRTFLATKPEFKVGDKIKTGFGEWEIWHNKLREDGWEGFGERGQAAQRVKNELNPPKKIRQKEVLERTRNILFKPYPNFEVLVEHINDHKYSFDDNVVNWNSTMIMLTKALKILKSIDQKYYANRNKYNLLFKSKVFLSRTTLKFGYNRNTYTIIINTGLTFNGNETEISNSLVSFKALDNQFAILIEKMEKELPKERFDVILDRIRILASD
jgi:hypothetical protein